LSNYDPEIVENTEFGGVKAYSKRLMKREGGGATVPPPSPL
jgi:hypothetical protein